MCDLAETIRIRYQPIIRLADRRALSAEVLVRQAGPSGRLRGPKAILKAMMGSEISLRITSAIIADAFAEYNTYRLDETGIILIFNLPLMVLQHPDLLRTMEALRARAGVPAKLICFELTEQDPVRDVAQAGAIIFALREAGYMLALDDVTPDMPNLAALLSLPIDAIKIDRSITISDDPADHAFIRRLLAHGDDHGQTIIAEGIETVSVLERMEALRVTLGQGFLFARPLSAAGLKQFLQPADPRLPS